MGRAAVNRDGRSSLPVALHRAASGSSVKLHPYADGTSVAPHPASIVRGQGLL